MLEGLLELLAPTRCAGCDLPGTLLCDACIAALPSIAGTEACPRCGAPDAARHCAECDGRDFAFELARCAGVFAHPLSRAVVLFKDSGERRLAPVLGGLAASAAGCDWIRWAEAVVGVPASSAAVLRRGFDHGALLADEVASRLGVPRLDTLTCESRGDQRRLGREARAANVAAAVCARPGAEVPSRILLVDDVLTTGATLDAAARALLVSGAESVRALTVARACEW
jgi:predicted amidophosphoribosyltransferase